MKLILLFFKYFRWIYLAFFVVALATSGNDYSHSRIFLEYKVTLENQRNRVFADSIVYNNIDCIDIAFAGNCQMHLCTREEKGDLYLVPDRIIDAANRDKTLFNSVGLQTIKDYITCYKFEKERLPKIIEYKKIVHFPLGMDLYSRYFCHDIYSLLLMHLFVILNFFVYKRLRRFIQYE